jgi:hypothetical protein
MAHLSFATRTRRVLILLLWYNIILVVCGKHFEHRY